jgi:hypothetical protein
LVLVLSISGAVAKPQSVVVHVFVVSLEDVVLSLVSVFALASVVVLNLFWTKGVLASIISTGTVSTSVVLILFWMSIVSTSIIPAGVVSTSVVLTTIVLGRLPKVASSIMPSVTLSLVPSATASKELTGLG